MIVAPGNLEELKNVILQSMFSALLVLFVYELLEI